MKEGRIIDNKTNNEMIYWIGENAQDNWDLIDLADQNDLWFHLSNQPSAHIILRMNNLAIKKLSKQTLIHCAVECKMHSKFSNTTKQRLHVIYTEIKNVSKAQNVGAVYTKNENYLLL